MDIYWKMDKQWYYYDDFVPKIKDDAPEDVKESFEHYRQQLKEVYD